MSQLRDIVMCVFVAGIFAVNAYAYCALKVEVKSPSGDHVARVPIEVLREHRISIAEAASDANGHAEICDLPLGFVDVVVGQDICGSVMVRSIKPLWPQTVELVVTYADLGCNHVAPSPRALVLFRVKDTDGKFVEGASFTDASQLNQGTTSSDVSGRIFRSVQRGQVLEGTISMNGYLRQAVRLRVMDDLEMDVLLRKRQN